MNNDNNYYQPPPPPVTTEGDTGVMSTKDWVVTLIISAIPCVGLVMLFVWGFGGTGNINRRNFCRAYLIFIAIGVVLGILLNIILIAIVGTAFNSVFDTMHLY